MKPLSAGERQHMKAVFGVLAGGVVAACAGAWLSFNVVQLPPLLCLLGEAAGIFYVASTSGSKNDTPRLAGFGGVAFLSGASLGPLLSYANFLNPAIVTHSLFLTLAIFTCFFLSAAYSERRAWLYMAPLLGAASSLLFWISIFGMFSRTNFTHIAMLYGGLLVSMGYLYFYCQKTLVDYEMGNRDQIAHAMQFYLHLVSVFIRIVVIMAEREEKKDDERQRKRQ